MKLTDHFIKKFDNIWVTSDFHFNHKSIIKFEQSRQQFKDVDQMDNFLIDLWNSTVKNNDLVLYLGDFALCLDDKIISKYSKLNGVKYLAKGNHDERSESTFKRIGFSKVESYFEYDQIIFCHIPIHPDQLIDRWKANVHGHMHSIKLDNNRYFNACIDAHPQFKMWNLKDVIEHLQLLEFGV